MYMYMYIYISSIYLCVYIYISSHNYPVFHPIFFCLQAIHPSNPPRPRQASPKTAAPFPPWASHQRPSRWRQRDPANTAHLPGNPWKSAGFRRTCGDFMGISWGFQWFSATKLRKLCFFVFSEHFVHVEIQRRCHQQNWEKLRIVVGF
jgi:hypothetical protein